MATTDVGIKLKIEGEKEYKQSLKDIIASQKEWQSEIKAVDSALESEMSAEDKAAKKKELLTKSIEDQEKKLGLMKDQLAKVENAYGKDSREAAQMRTNINNATTALNRMRGESQKLTPKLKNIGDTMQKAGKKMQVVGDKLNKYVAAPLGALAATSVAAFKEVDAGMDIVTKKTGATGQALIDLQESARNVATTIPTSFETAGSAIGEVNTKFGLVGEDLEDLTLKFVKFADLNDMDVSNAVDKTQKVMKAFGVESKDAGKILDAMNKVGQNTGISMDSLSDTMVKNAASLRDMGMDAYDAANFLGQVEMSGATTADVMAGMKKAMTEAAKDGMTLPEKLKEFDIIMHSSASETDKLQAAIETFGKKAGPAIYKAYEEGTLNLGLLSGSMDEFVGSVDQTYDDIKGSNNDMEVSLNKVKDAASRIGETLLNIAAEPVSKVADGVQSIGDKFDSLDSDSQESIGNVILGLIGAGTAAKVGGSLLSAVGKVAGAISGAGGLTAAIGSVGSSAAGLVAAGAPFLAVGAIAGLAAAVVWKASQDVTTSNETVNAAAEAQKQNIDALKESMAAIDELITTTNTDIDNINNQEATALALVDELDALAGQSNRTAQEEAHMRAVVDELNTMYPDLKLNIDKNTGSLNKSTKQIKDYIKEAKKIALLDAYTRASQKATDALVEANDKLYRAKKQQGELDKVYRGAYETYYKAQQEYWRTGKQADDWLNEQYKAMVVAEKNVNDNKVAIAGYEEKVAKAEETVSGWTEQIDDLTGEMAESKEATEASTETTDANTAAQKSNMDAYMERAEKIGKSTRDAIKAMQEEQAKWDELYNSAKESIEGQSKLFDEWQQDSELTYEKIISNMQSQVTGMQNYSTNMDKLERFAAQSGNETLKAYVKYIRDMGLEGAQVAQEMVTHWTDSSGELSEALAEEALNISSEYSGLQDTIAGTWATIDNGFQTGAEAGMAAFNAIFARDELEGLKEMKANAETVFDNAVTTIFGKGKEVAKAATDGMIDEEHEAEQDASLKRRYEKAGESIAEGLDGSKEKVATAAEGVSGEVSGISGDIDESAKNIKSSANQSVLGLISGMVLNKLLLASTALGISGTIGSISTVIEGKQAYLKKSGQNSVGAIADGMGETRKSDLEPEVEEVGTVVKSTVVTVGQMIEDFKSSGRQVIRGLTIGMDQEAVNAYDKATAIAGMIKTIINNALKIHSPSRVMMESGRYISEGLALGMEQQLPEVEKASAMLARSVVPFGATNSDVIQLRAEAFGGFDVDQIYAAVRSGAADGQQPVIISEKSFKRALVGMGVQVA